MDIEVLWVIDVFISARLYTVDDLFQAQVSNTFDLAGLAIMSASASNMVLRYGEMVRTLGSKSSRMARGIYRVSSDCMQFVD